MLMFILVFLALDNCYFWSIMSKMVVHHILFAKDFVLNPTFVIFPSSLCLFMLLYDLLGLHHHVHLSLL
jgi:hypothetical protein